jgi:hypothetical protein
MKTLEPLAAALLLMAASASAQPFSAGAGTGFNLTGNNSGGLVLAPGSSPVDDMVFKCGTVPYVACTAAQLNLREAVRTSGKCPSPAIPACVDYLMKQSGSSNPAETIAAYTPPDGTKWASPDCTHIPCKLADDAGKGAIESGLPYDQQPGFIGPPAPPKNNLPPAFDSKEFQKELAAARADSSNTIVDLGDNRYGVVLDDGSVSVCGKGLCNMPRPASEFPKLAEQIQAANSINSGAKSLNSDNPNAGFQANSEKQAPQTPSITNSGRTSGSPDNAAEDTSASDEAKGFGRQAAADSVAVSGSDPSSGAGSSVASNGSSSGGEAGAGQVIKTKAAALGSIEITYTRLQKTESDIKGAAGAFNNGQMTGFASPNAPAASGRLAEPPVDEKYLGKIQAASNE